MSASNLTASNNRHIQYRRGEAPENGYDILRRVGFNYILQR